MDPEENSKKSIFVERVVIFGPGPCPCPMGPAHVPWARPMSHAAWPMSHAAWPMSHAAWSKNPKNVKKLLKWVQKNAPGVLRPWGGSKLRCESNGMPPGPQNPHKKSKNPKIPDIINFKGFWCFLYLLFGFWGSGGIPLDSQRNFDPP